VEVERSAAQLRMSGPDFGNTVLISGLLHVAMFYLRASGIVTLTNHPADARLERRYQSMGFDRGKRLALDDHGAVTTAFEFVEKGYQPWPRLKLSRAPLPL
jgi:hypothetical protein